MIRVGTIDEEMMSLLNNCGACKGIGIGIEHVRKNVLNRSITNIQIINTFNLCHKYGIEHYDDFVMVGLPFESKKLFHDSVKLCWKVFARDSISIFYPYPGTELGELCRNNRWMPDRDFYYERVEATINFPGFPKDQIQLCHDAFKYLIGNKSIPLSVPLEIIPAFHSLIKSYRIIKNHNRIKYLTRLFRSKS